GQLLDDARAGAPTSEPGGHDRHLEPLERPRDVDALAAGERQRLARAVPLAPLEVRDGQRPVERGVEGDGDDHQNQPAKWWTARPAYQSTLPKRPGRETERAATSGDSARSLPREKIRISPRRWPLLTGSETTVGATTCSTSGRSTRTTPR